MSEEIIKIEESVTIEEGNPRFEMMAGIVIAVFTAILAINGLAGDSYGSSILLDNTEKVSAYDWYNSKGIKQILAEGQANTMTGLLESGVIASGKQADFQKEIDKVTANSARYIKEKNEILQGSDNIPQNEWIQDVDGELGKVVGAQEWEQEIEKLDKAGSKSDLADLFLQICLVMGAVSLVMQKPRYKSMFLSLTVILGVLGTIFCVIGLITSWPF
ncbi:MAG: DUF4337 domain-containing protein [Candidatus Parcubacteria bacterium]|nr:DUF4337 domain-containing protein [Candidatus Parcubacteria bacterium]